MRFATPLPCALLSPDRPASAYLASDQLDAKFSPPHAVRRIFLAYISTAVPYDRWRACPTDVDAFSQQQLERTRRAIHRDLWRRRVDRHAVSKSPHMKLTVDDQAELERLPTGSAVNREWLPGGGGHVAIVRS